MPFSTLKIALLGLGLTSAQAGALAIKAQTSDGSAPSAEVSNLPIIYGTIKPEDKAAIFAALPKPGQIYSVSGQSGASKPTTTAGVTPTISPAHKPTTTSGAKHASSSASLSASSSASSSTAKSSARKRDTAKIHQRANGDGAFLTTSVGDFTYDCQQAFNVAGPFTSIRVTSDQGSGDLSSDTIMSGIELTDYLGNFSSFGRRTTQSGDTGTFSFAADEVVKSMTIYTASVDGASSPVGFSFHTSANNDFDSIQNGGGGVDVKPGYGYITGVRGCVDSHQNINSIGFDMLDNLRSLTISQIAYEGFVNNLAPSGAGQEITVGDQALDNTNSSISQSTTFTTTKTVTTTHQVSTDHTTSFGGKLSVEVDTGVSVPLLESSKIKVTTEFNWELSSTTSVSDSTTQTSTDSQAITLTCPAGKYCTDVANITKYTTSVNINATYTATTNSGATFWWLEQGTYTGQDSTKVLSQVSQYDVVQPSRKMRF